MICDTLVIFSPSGIRGVEKKSILERLDRALCNMEWSTKFSKSVVTHLERTYFDHSPLVNEFSEHTQGRGSVFRFLGVWINEVVKSSWKEDITGRPMYVSGRKLIRLKKCLPIWNEGVFGRIDQKVRDAEDEVPSCELAMMT